MKAKIEASISKRLPKLFGSKRSAQESEGKGAAVVVEVPTKKQPLAAPAPLQRPPTNNAPAEKLNLTSNAPAIDLAVGSIEQLDDFSLLRLLDKRVFINGNDSGSSSVILAIRLSPPSNQISASISRVLTKEEKKREIILAFTRFPEFRIHGVSSISNSSSFVISWSFPLSSLLALREAKRGSVVLQFLGGKERRIIPTSEIEKGWLFYCTTRLSREHGIGDPTVISFSSVRLHATEEGIKTRCPFLSKSEPTPRRPTIASGVQPTSFKLDLQKSDSSFLSEEDEDVLGGGDSNNNNPFFTRDEETGIFGGSTYRPKRGSFSIRPGDSLILNETFNSERLPPKQMIEHSKNLLIKLEKETLNELRAWESGNGPSISKNKTDLDHGRKGDPIASLLAHLEAVEGSLIELDDWMNQHDSSVIGMTMLARKIDNEIKGLREEGAFKEKMVEHLKEILEDLTKEEEQIITDLSIILPLVQRELETTNASSNFNSIKVTKVLKTIIQLRDKNEGNSKLLARRNRSKRMKDHCTIVGGKLSEFLQSRIDYYYKFERNDAREAHGRLICYQEFIQLLHKLSEVDFAQLHTRYQSEAGNFSKGYLIKSLEPYFLSTSSSDSITKYGDSSVDSLDVCKNERDVAMKEVHFASVEARKKFVEKLESLTKEEDSFCESLEFDFLPGFSLALDAVWGAISQRASNSPITFAAPVLCDMERLSRKYEKNGKGKYGIVIREKLVTRLQDALDRFVVDHASNFFEKAKRANPIFVKKYPAIVDRLEAATKGIYNNNNDESEIQQQLPRCKPLTENVLQLAGTLTNPFHKLENIYFLSTALRLRSIPSLSSLQSDIDSKLDVLMGEVVNNLFDSTPFAFVAQVAKLSSDDENGLIQTTLSRNDFIEAIRNLQGNVEKAVLQLKTITDGKISNPKLKSKFIQHVKETLVGSYWKFAEVAAENFGIVVQPTPAIVKNELNKWN